MELKKKKKQKLGKKKKENDTVRVLLKEKPKHIINFESLFEQKFI